MGKSRCTCEPFCCGNNDRGEIHAVIRGARYSASEIENDSYDLDFSSDLGLPSLNSLDDPESFSIRERMRQDMTQSDLAQASQKIIEMLSELVAQLVIPAVLDHLPTRDIKHSEDVAREDATREDSKCVHCRGGDLQNERVIASVESVASLEKGMGDVLVSTEDDLPLYAPHTPSPPFSCSSEMDTDKNLETNLELVPQKAIQAETEYTSLDKDMLSDMVVNMENDVWSAPHTPSPPFSLSEFGGSKMLAEKDLDKFLELAPQRAIQAIINSLDKKEGTKAESHAWKILCYLHNKMKYTEEKTKREDKVRSVASYSPPPCSCFDRKFKKKVKETFTNSHERLKSENTNPSPYSCTEITYPLTVSSKQVIREVSSSEFRSTSLKGLTEFLETSLYKLSLAVGETSFSPSSVDMMASDLLDTVTSSVTQLSLPQQKQFWPWRKKKCSTVSEAAVGNTALVLKTSLQQKLTEFFCGHELAAAELEEDTMKEAEEQSEGIQEHEEEHEEEHKEEHEEEHSIGGISQDKIKLKPAGSTDIKRVVSAPSKLEKLISQDQLVLFSKMVTNRVTYMFQEKAQQLPNLQNPNSQPQVLENPLITLRKELHSFIEDAVRCLLASVAFPPPFWRMDHLGQENTTVTNAAMMGKTYDNVASVYSELVAQQVMEHLNKSSILQVA